MAEEKEGNVYILYWTGMITNDYNLHRGLFFGSLTDP